MRDPARRLPPEADEAWQSYQELRLAKHRHKVLLSNPIADAKEEQESLRHHEQCIAAFREATQKLQRDNPEAHKEFLRCLAEEPDA